MTERFPEQRNRSAQRRADAEQVPASAVDGVAWVDDAMPVFNESFIAAAPVREPSAQERAALARQRTGPSADPSPTLPALEPLRRRWTVRPSHHLSAVRLPAVAAAVCALAAASLLLILLR